MEYTLEQIHDIELEILKVLMDVCKRNNIDYFAIGGTLLGAVRHHGFIPWDDDIDLGMTRDNFNKLIAVKDDFKKPYFLQIFETDNNYPFPNIKLVKLDDSVKEAKNHNSKTKRGFFIDVFSFDRMSNNKLVRFIHLYDYRLRQSKISMDLHWRRATGKNKLVNLFYIFSHKSVSELVHERDTIMQKYNNNSKLDYYNISSQYGPDREKLLISEITNITNLDFEGLQLPVLADYDVVLTRQYGDYMQLPAEHQRISKHLD